jgi:putative ABC transport system ATP-binding protein
MTYRDGRGSFDALRNVDLEIDRGAFVVIAGPSGSGKTTLLNLIGGLDRATMGSISFDGQDLARMTAAGRAELRLRKIGFVFQSYNLIPVLTAVENVEFVLRLQGVPRTERERRARAILEEVGLGRESDRRPAALSGGQQQRVAVARALVTQPSMVLADEPTANLDSKTAGELLELMRRLNAKLKTTFVISTHDPMIIESAPRVVSLKDGRIVGDNGSFDALSAHLPPPAAWQTPWVS